MSEGNQTTVKEFIIMGFPGLQPQYYWMASMALFLVYVSTLLGNLLTTTLLLIEEHLHKPMYFIILNLALSDICFSTVTLPKIISKYWFQASSISFSGCFLQMQLVHYFGTLNSFIMMIMALDRYVAICYPLRYPVLIKNTTIFLLSGIAWLVSWIFPTVNTVQAYALPYCGPNTIIQCYCDTFSITRLACADIQVHTLVAFTLAMSVLLVPLCFIIYSYIQIILSVLKITSSQGRHKAFSTCSAQFCIITLYYGPRCFVYIANVTHFPITTDFRILMILFYSLIPPVFNPVIYFFRTKEIKQSLVRRFRGRQIHIQRANITAVCS
ncbi:OLF1 protein, partial [Amia calva]|nr:OLF1 protein [Amia calva]